MIHLFHRWRYTKTGMIRSCSVCAKTQYMVYTDSGILSKWLDLSKGVDQPSIPVHMRKYYKPLTGQERSDLYKPYYYIGKRRIMSDRVVMKFCNDGIAVVAGILIACWLI